MYRADSAYFRFECAVLRLRRDERNTWIVCSVSTRIAGQYRPLHDCGMRTDIKIGQYTQFSAAASPITQEHLAGEKKRFSWNGLHGERAFVDYGFEFFDPGKSDREFRINNRVDCQSVCRTCGVELPL